MATCGAKASHRNLSVSSEGPGAWERMSVFWDSFIQPLLRRDRALREQLFNGHSTLHRCSGCNQQHVSHVDYDVLQLGFPANQDLFDTLSSIFKSSIKSSTSPIACPFYSVHGEHVSLEDLAHAHPPVSLSVTVDIREFGIMFLILIARDDTNINADLSVPECF